MTESVYCAPCKKKYSNKTTYRNHLNSKKHKKNAKKFKEDAPDTASPSEPVSVLPTITAYKDQKVCLFSNHESSSIEE